MSSEGLLLFILINLSTYIDLLLLNTALQIEALHDFFGFLYHDGIYLPPGHHWVIILHLFHYFFERYALLRCYVPARLSYSHAVCKVFSTNLGLHCIICPQITIFSHI